MGIQNEDVRSGIDLLVFFSQTTSDEIPSKYIAGISSLIFQNKKKSQLFGKTETERGRVSTATSRKNISFSPRLIGQSRAQGPMNIFTLFFPRKWSHCFRPLNADLFLKALFMLPNPRDDPERENFNVRTLEEACWINQPYFWQKCVYPSRFPPVAQWSRGMIRASGARGPGF